MSTKQRLRKLEEKAGLNQEQLIVFIQWLTEKGEWAYDSAKSGDQVFRRQPEESREDFEERIAEAVRNTEQGPVIVVHWGETGQY